MAEPGYVYFLHLVATDRVKIGRTGDLVKRLRQLDGQQHGFPLRLLWAQRYADMQTAERTLHQHYDAFRVHGEWFVLPQDVMAQFYDQQPEDNASETSIPPVVHSVVEEDPTLEQRILGDIMAHGAISLEALLKQLGFDWKIAFSTVKQQKLWALVEEHLDILSARGAILSYTDLTTRRPFYRLASPHSPILDYPSQLLTEESTP